MMRQGARAQDGNASTLNPVYRIDRAVQRTVRDSVLQQQPTVVAITRAGNWWGGPGVIWFSAALWLGARALARRRLSTVGLRCLEAIAVSSAISGILKGLAGRSRPFVVPQEPWHWSFAHGWTDARFFSMPSGHTTATFAFAAAATVSLAAARPCLRVALTGLGFVSALLVALARVFTDQHWFSDVVFAVALGTVTGLALTRWHNRHPGTPFDHALLGGTDPAAP